MNAQQQYALEMQQRYFKYLQQEDEREYQLLEKEKRRQKKLQKKQESKTPVVPASLQEYKIHNIIIDSDLRDTGLYPNANDFVVRLQEPYKMVVALRILKTEFYQPSNSFGYFVLNEAKIPLQLYNVSHAYLYVNGYTNTAIVNESNIALMGRIGPGMEMYPSVSGDPLKDPFIYVFRPIEGKLRRFHVKLVNADGSAYPVTNARVVLTIAVYCVAV